MLEAAAGKSVGWFKFVVHCRMAPMLFHISEIMRELF